MDSKVCKTISLAASKYNWSDVEKRAYSVGFKEVSKYIQYLVERDIHTKRMRDIRFTEVMMLLGIALCVVLIVLLR